MRIMMEYLGCIGELNHCLRAAYATTIFLYMYAHMYVVNNGPINKNKLKSKEHNRKNK